MRFWDSSAILPLVIEQQPFSRTCQLLLADRGARAVGFSARIECRSGVERLFREGLLPAVDRARAVADLDALLDRFDVVAFSNSVENRALELLGRHELRALDAMQLACALALRGGRTARLVAFVSCDRRLGRAAAAEGLDLVPAQ